MACLQFCSWMKYLQIQQKVYNLAMHLLYACYRKPDPAC